MKLSDRQIKKRLAVQEKNGDKGKPAVGEKETIRISEAAFYENEAEDVLSDFEFLYQQSQWIRKRWWFLQAAVLAVLWTLMKLTESGYFIQRYMGILAPLFAMLILPELWKNRSCYAIEVEYTAYYSLRQIYAARMVLFVLVDFFLLTAFVSAGIRMGKILAEEMIVQFFLPYFVTCCICFRTLYSRKINSEAFALLLCVLWCLVWVFLVLDQKIYDAVAQPVWMGMTALSMCYLGYCIYRGQTFEAKKPEDRLL